MMDLERFRTLAEAYGGRVARWPAGEQEDAFALMARNGEACEAVLAEALALDDALGELRPTPASAMLRDRILAAAPVPGRGGLGGLARWLVGAGVGMGLATACVAGMLVGAHLAPQEPLSGTEAMLTGLYADETWLEPEAENRS